MPTLEENRDYWKTYDWPESGDEWSQVWGTTDLLWSGTLWPRLRAFLPTGRVVEIAPGYGRITNLLKDFCTELVGIDLSERCVQACTERFADAAHTSFWTTDGRSLPGIEDSSVDFVVSFDSLVHADATVLEAYIGEVARVLRPRAGAFLHHSNLAAYRDEQTGELSIENKHWRDPTVSAAAIRTICDRVGLYCPLQEIVAWGGTDLNDCFSVIFQDPDRRGEETRVIENTRLMDEAIQLAELARLYGATREE